eukprot:m.34886 g.34886  ORF g.34886 m.34886 type:complete len:198 (+) comp5274_c0_seq2:166-759(+)
MGRPSPQAMGVLYEAAMARYFARLGVRLRRSGGADDKGIDLRGYWTIPAHRSPAEKGAHAGQVHTDTELMHTVPVVLQCKRYAKPCPPAAVREFDGALARELPGTLGILVCSSGFTAKAKEAFVSCAQPLVLSAVTDEDELEHFEMNAAGQRILPMLTIGREYVAGGRTRPVLLCAAGAGLRPLADIVPAPATGPPL